MLDSTEEQCRRITRHLMYVSAVVSKVAYYSMKEWINGSVNQWMQQLVIHIATSPHFPLQYPGNKLCSFIQSQDQSYLPNHEQRFYSWNFVWTTNCTHVAKRCWPTLLCRRIALNSAQCDAEESECHLKSMARNMQSKKQTLKSHVFCRLCSANKFSAKGLSTIPASNECYSERIKKYL